MRRLRVLLSLLLGLSLMTQGMAVAVAAASPMQMKMASSMASIDMSADGHDMPCMDMDMSDHGTPAKCPAKCCDGKVCFDMSSCAQAQPAMSAYRLPVVYADAEHNAPVPLVLSMADSPPTSLLRPPITFHS